MLFVVIGLLIGLFVGYIIPYQQYNPIYSLYISIAILACLDSVFGGIRASLEEKFDVKIYFSGLIGNAILAAFLAFLGEKLGVPLYFAAIITFGCRLFDNFASIRRNIMKKNNHSNFGK